MPPLRPVQVNVAFASVFAPFWEIKPEEFRRVTEVSYLGFVHGTMAALARMRPRDRGTIIQCGSALGYRAIPLQSAYCGAKHAINGFTESVRCELLHEGSHVRITVVQMPAVNTPQFSWVLSRLPRRAQPVPPIYQPEVAAKGIVFAADHPDRKEHWVGASTVGTIVAQKFAAPLLDRYLARTGYDSQQTKEPADQGEPTNLWQPVDEQPGSDRGVHGDFDDSAHARSVQLNITEAVEEAGSAIGEAFGTVKNAASPGKTTGVLDTGAPWQSMVRAARNLGRPGLVSYAISAVDTALWDLKATLLGLPVSRLLGAVRGEVPVYGSGGFTTYDEGAARAQLKRWTGDLRIPRVKIKIGESWGTEPGRDLARIAFARRVIGPDAELYVDANGGYTRKQARPGSQGVRRGPVSRGLSRAVISGGYAMGPAQPPVFAFPLSRR